MILPLSPQVFSLISSLVEERAGLFYSPADAELLASKLSVRADELGFDALLDYYYFLRYDEGGEAECVRLVEALLVHETYFFREAEALRALVEHVLEPRVRRGERVRIWCAACATGEEPLTLAMMLAARGMLAASEIVATDLSARALAKAQEGVHGRRALRALPETGEAYTRWLRTDGDRAVVVPDLIAHVRWQRLNLIHAQEVQALGRFDAILCRNVLIYFRDDVVQRVIGSLAAALVDDGVLQVGVSESLMRFGSLFDCKELGGSFFYERAP